MVRKVIPDALRILSAREKATARVIAWRKANPERAAAIDARSREKTKAKRYAYTRAWREQNKERLKAYQAEYDASEKRKENRQIRHERDRDAINAKTSERFKSNPLLMKLKKQRRRARKLAAEGSHTYLELQALWERQGSICANPHCGRVLNLGNRALDHIVALSRGGSNWVSNLQWLCIPCNGRKSNLPLDLWLKREARRTKRLSSHITYKKKDRYA